MLFQSFITTALFAAISAGFPIETPEVEIVENDVNTTISELDVRATFQDVYKMYTGDGSHFKAGWPNMDFWGTWDQIWNANVPLMRKSCGWNGWGKDNSETEIGYIKSSLVTVSGEVGIDKRFLLAIVMQESKGCVRVPTTPSGSGHNNPGLMQSHAGKGTCAGVANCSKAQVLLMIRDGSAGTSAGDGLKQTFAKTKAYIGSSGSQALYAAARMYNSGSVDYKNLNNGFISNKCYVVDVANRLTGWTSAASKCS